MRGVFALACMFVASACAHPVAEQPVTHAPFLAAAPPAPPSPAPPPAPAPEPDTDITAPTLASLDLCPDEPATPTGLFGCSDADDIYTGDRCPDLPETFNDLEDSDGCPDADPPHVVRLHALAARIQFKNSKKNLSTALSLTTPAITALRDVADILQAHPNIHLQVAIHTAQGDDMPFARVGLSHARAATIFENLVAQGVDASRLQTYGYGTSAPLVTGKSRAALARNRRVEFSLYPPPASTPPADILQ